MILVGNLRRSKKFLNEREEFMRFKDFNLEVVTVERTSYDYQMTLNKNVITFSKGIVEELNYPNQVLFAFNKDTKVMGIQVCRSITKSSFKFSKNKEKQKGVVTISNRNLREALLHMMDDWDSSKRYRVEGIYLPEDKAFIFELSKYHELKNQRK